MKIDLQPSAVFRALARQLDLLDDDGQVRGDVERVAMIVPGRAEPLVLYPENQVYKEIADASRERVAHRMKET